MEKSGKLTGYQSGYLQHLERVLNVDDAMNRVQDWREEVVRLSEKASKTNKQEEAQEKRSQVKQKTTFQDGRPDAERWYKQRNPSRLESKPIFVTPQEIESRRVSWNESLENGNYQVLRRTAALTARWKQRREEMGDNMALVKSKPKTADDAPAPGKNISRPHTHYSLKQGGGTHDLSLRSDYASLRVGNLSGDAGTSDLQALFTKALTVTKPIPEVECGNQQFFAFVLFSTRNDAAEALMKYQGRRIQDQNIILTYRKYNA